MSEETTRFRVLDNSDVRVQLLANTRVAVLGYGAQGHAHAQNLRDSGIDVIVGQRPGGSRHEQAVADGFEPVSIVDAVRAADLLILGLPDDSLPAIYAAEIEPQLRAGQTLGFMHGFVIRYGLLTPREDVDVVMVAPKAQGRGVRREFAAGRGVASLVACSRDASGQAHQRMLGWAAGIGSNRAAIFETTFSDETETDLFGEQAVLCGGMSNLIKAGFDTLVEAGYPPELAYFECCHEIKLLADLVYDYGISGMRERISTTARFGDLTRGPRVIGPDVREAMRDLLEEIQSGEFAQEVVDDVATGRARSRTFAESEQTHPIEPTGERIRKLLWRM